MNHECGQYGSNMWMFDKVVVVGSYPHHLRRREAAFGWPPAKAHPAVEAKVGLEGQPRTD